MKNLPGVRRYLHQKKVEPLQLRATEGEVFCLVVAVRNIYNKKMMIYDLQQKKQFNCNFYNINYFILINCIKLQRYPGARFSVLL